MFWYYYRVLFSGNCFHCYYHLWTQYFGYWYFAVSKQKQLLGMWCPEFVWFQDVVFACQINCFFLKVHGIKAMNCEAASASCSKCTPDPHCGWCVASNRWFTLHYELFKWKLANHFETIGWLWSLLFDCLKIYYFCSAIPVVSRFMLMLVF